MWFVLHFCTSLNGCFGRLFAKDNDDCTCIRLRSHALEIVLGFGVDATRWKMLVVLDVSIRELSVCIDV